MASSVAGGFRYYEEGGIENKRRDKAWRVSAEDLERQMRAGKDSSSLSLELKLVQLQKLPHTYVFNTILVRQIQSKETR